ncbi:MAG: general secretion pathway protein GspK [Candidatus Omnitrophica bacterium]|nr:general secretion pathway protein GspK [Candidatus Omnitrophota bacterium]
MNKKNGFILIYVLGVTFAFVSLILFFNYKVKKYLDSFTGYYKEIEKENIFELGFELAKKILENDTNNNDWLGETWNIERNFRINEYEVKIIISDENGKININKIMGEKGQVNQLLFDLIKSLFQVCGYSSSLLDCFFDWIDEDNLPRAEGAEEIYYKSIGLINLPPNRNLLSLRELFLIKGFDNNILEGEEENEGLLSFVTIYSDDKININTCKGQILNAMGFTKSQVDSIMVEREYRPLNERFLTRVNRQVFLKYRNLIKYNSNYFRVLVYLKDEKENEAVCEGIIKKDKSIELIRKGIL